MFTDSSIYSKTLEFEWDTQGSVLLLQWNCPDHHFEYWDSSEILCLRGTSKVYSLNLMLAASVFLEIIMPR